METKELKITIPEGFDIDKKKSTFEKIVFKKKDTKPRSWEEYCKQQMEKKKIGYYIDDTECYSVEAHWNGCISQHIWKNVLPSKELTEAFLAMMQLMSLRQSWIGDWEPDWSCENTGKYFIQKLYDNKEYYRVQKSFCWCRPLSFPTYEMAEDFMNCFKDLLEIAKPLI